MGRGRDSMFYAQDGFMWRFQFTRKVGSFGFMCRDFSSRKVDTFLKEGGYSLIRCHSVSSNEL